jgi:hypothetical protein
MSESECRTAVFEERSVTSELTNRTEHDLAAERMEAFKVR